MRVRMSLNQIETAERSLIMRLCFVSAIVLTIIVNIYWADMTSYNLAFAVSFSMIFFFPIFYKFSEKTFLFLQTFAREKAIELYKKGES